MTKHFILLALLASMTTLASAQVAPDRDGDEAAIRAVVAGLTEAWAAGDGEAWGAAFAEDADFTVWFGLSLAGREEIAQGHGYIFDSIYAGTTFHLDVRKIRFLGPDAAAVHLEGRVTGEGEAMPEEPDAVPLAVMARGERGWEIVAFQNTPYVVEQFRRDGNLRRFKETVAESGGE